VDGRDIAILDADGLRACEDRPSREKLICHQHFIVDA
jgi:hypothetical protein